MSGKKCRVSQFLNQEKSTRNIWKIRKGNNSEKNHIVYNDLSF